MPQSIPRGHVLKALVDLDAGVDHDFGEPTGFHLLHRGRPYAPKPVIGLACPYLIGRVLRHGEFRGGEAPGQANYVLRPLGFTVVHKGERAKGEDTTVPASYGESVHNIGKVVNNVTLAIIGVGVAGAVILTASAPGSRSGGDKAAARRTRERPRQGRTRSPGPVTRATAGGRLGSAGLGVLTAVVRGAWPRGDVLVVVFVRGRRPLVVVAGGSVRAVRRDAAVSPGHRLEREAGGKS